MLKEAAVEAKILMYERLVREAHRMAPEQVLTRTYGIDLKVFGYTEGPSSTGLSAENPDAINTLYTCLGRTSVKPFWASPLLQAPLFQSRTTTNQASSAASNLLPPSRQGVSATSPRTSHGGTKTGPALGSRMSQPLLINQKQNLPN